MLLVLGTSKPGSCDSAVDDGSRPHLTRHENWKLFAAASDGDGWRVCGKLELTSKYHVYAATGLQRVVRQMGGMDVALSVDSGLIRCKCHAGLELDSPPNVDTTAQPLAFEVQIADGNDNRLNISIPLEAPCYIAFCQSTPTNLLKIYQRTDESLSLQLSPECSLLKKYENSPLHNILHILEDGAVALSLPVTNVRDNRVKSPAMAHRITQTVDKSNNVIQIGQRHESGRVCMIDVIRSIDLPNMVPDSPDSQKIKFIHTLALDPSSCVNSHGHQQREGPADPSILQVLSIKPWLSSRHSHFANHNSQGLFASLQAKPSTVMSLLNSIHDKGSYVVGAAATKHRVAGKIRKVRQSSSPPVFNDTFYMASIRENSATGTIVTSVQATGNGAITYTMTPDNGFSGRLFAMNSSTGVVTTTGLSSFYYMCNSVIRFM